MFLKQIINLLKLALYNYKNFVNRLKEANKEKKLENNKKKTPNIIETKLDEKAQDKKSNQDVVFKQSEIKEVESLNQEELKPLIESGKKSFKGRELTGGTLGVVGMGAIGSKVADMGVMLGMNVIGYDPAITVEAAWKLPNKVERKESIEDVFKESDYISLHVPANDKTKGLINSDLLKKLKLINKNSSKLKILGTGEIKSKINIEADLASKSAVEKLEKIGGSIQLKK